MVSTSLLELVGVVGLAMAAPLFAVSTQRCSGSAFASVFGLLTATVVLGIAAVLVDLALVSEPVKQSLTVTIVGAAAVLSVGTATRLVRLTSGRWSV
jgi:hypothetical protein